MDDDHAGGDMDKVIGRLIFLSIFFTLVFLMHFYSFRRLASLFEIDRKTWHYLLLILMASSIIFSTILCRIAFNPATRALYIVCACWFGIQLLIFSAVLAYEIPRLFLNIKGPVAGTAILAVVGVLSVAAIINAQFYRVKKVEIASFGEELNAVLLSDLHVGTIWGKDYLRKIVDTTNSLKPDVIFITGDALSGGAAMNEDVLSPLGDLEAKAFFVNGNHEHYDGPDDIRHALENMGIRVLRDQEVEFEGIEIIGIDYTESRKHIQSVLSQSTLSDGRPTIVLSHAPIDPEDDRVELMLSGHTHAGQIFPFNFVIRLRYKFMKGLYTRGNTRIYVTPGTNTWGPPMRLGSRNEITLLELKK